MSFEYLERWNIKRKKKQAKITEMRKELFFSFFYFYFVVVDKKPFIMRKWYQEWLLNIYRGH